MDCFTARRARATVTSGVPPHTAGRLCWLPSAPRPHRFRARRRPARLRARAERRVFARYWDPRRCGCAPCAAEPRPPPG